jgi:hypothetical protein
MASYTLHTITVDVRTESGVFQSAPAHNTEPETGTYDTIVRFSSADGWVGDFAVVHFPVADITMGRFIWTGGVIAAPYDRLTTAGNISVKTVDDRWLVPVRAMRPGGKPYPTLNRISEEELDTLTGFNFRDLLARFGDFELGRYGDFLPSAGKQVVNGLGLTMEKGNTALLGAMIAVTRPVALVKGL